MSFCLRLHTQLKSALYVTPMDLSKAFDSVPHERLLLKLNRYGIDGQLHLWFRNFLTKRKQRVLIRGTFSEWSPVISGVPQGSILGPIMFLIYVNDIPNIITSTAKLFADDTKIYRQINNVQDSIALQLDLTTLDLWADRWQVTFNPTKCEIMRISHNRDKSSKRYQISGTVLRNVSHYKDLGVIMASDLKWSKHVEHIVHKANKVLGLLKRTVGGKNKDIFSNLYKTLVRPILEYACPVWSPHLAKDIHEIEKVQRRASRIALNQRRQEMAYEERCKLLKWNSLVRRREFLSLVECYKIVFNLNGLNFSDYFELCRNTKTRSNHPYKIQTKLAKLNCYKHSFFVKIIKSWNDLPCNVIDYRDRPNVKKFKLRLKNHMNIY